jgi:hypothetical protein
VRSRSGSVRSQRGLTPAVAKPSIQCQRPSKKVRSEEDSIADEFESEPDGWFNLKDNAKAFIA